MRGWIRFFIIIMCLLAGIVAVYLWVVNACSNWEMSRSWNVSLGDFSVESLIFDEDVITYRQKFDEALDMLESVDLTGSVVVVDISEQKEYIFIEDGTFVDVYKVSTGSADMMPVEGELECDDEDEDCEMEYVSREMGSSVWRVRNKLEGPFSSFYGARVMMLDRWMGYSWVGTSVALHGTNRPDLLGTPWSLGCVYHENADIIELYDLLEVGDLVIAIE